jgi:hypothetical protein
MAGPLRIEYYGAYYHVMNCGNSNHDIFLADRMKLESHREVPADMKLRRSLTQNELSDPSLIEFAIGKFCLCGEFWGH